jgi:hypothetical protein
LDSTWRFVEPDHISAGITEARRNLGRIGTDWLHDLATLGDNGIDSRSNTVTPDIDQQPWRACRRSTSDPSATHCAGGIVESCGAIAPLPKSPTKDFFVELRCATNVEGRNLDVTDFPCAFL